MYKPRFLINTHINLRVLDIFEKDSKLARCCIHEAGHAIIYTAFGGVVESVTVYPQGGGLTTTRFNCPLDSRNEDMIYMSGYFFEALVCGRYRQPFIDNHSRNIFQFIPRIFEILQGGMRIKLLTILSEWLFLMILL